MTWAELEQRQSHDLARHAVERRALALETLERCGWQLATAARALQVHEIVFRRYVESDEVLGPLYRERKPGRGRPRKV